MREGWKRYKIEELGRIITGKTPSTQNLENFGTKYPFITPKDMVGRKRIFQTERYLSEEGKNAVKNCLLPPNSVCVSCIGSDMGKVVMTTKSSVTNQQLNSLVCSHMFDSDFVYYAVTNISESLKNAGHHSTAVPILNKSDFSNFEIDAPDLLTQRRIAAILSALDDKIELNRQTNQTLEAIAQALFKEWFVDFRFPGSTGEMQDSELGPIPKGWRVGKLGDLLSFRNGKSSPERNNINGYPVYGANGVIGFASIYNSTDRTIIIGRVGSYCGAIYYTTQKAFVTENAIIAEAYNQNSSLFSFFLMERLNLNNYKVGSGQPLLNQTILEGIDVLLPYEDIVGKFENVLLPHFINIQNNEQQSTTLAAIRDALLPKLMNGEVGVALEEIV